MQQLDGYRGSRAPLRRVEDPGQGGGEKFEPLFGGSDGLRVGQLQFVFREPCRDGFADKTYFWMFCAVFQCFFVFLASSFLLF